LFDKIKFLFYFPTDTAPHISIRVNLGSMEEWLGYWTGNLKFKSHSDHKLDLFQEVRCFTPWLHKYIAHWSAPSFESFVSLAINTHMIITSYIFSLPGKNKLILLQVFQQFQGRLHSALTINQDFKPHSTVISTLIMYALVVLY